MAHYFDMSGDVVGLEGEYSTLKCIDFSMWAATNPAEQAIFIRVYQDLTPDFQPNAPEAGTCCSLLLAQENILLPPSQEGVPSADPNVSPGRTDGDFSLEFFGIEGGGRLISPDAMIWCEVGHLGESQVRFATNTSGEKGDGAADYRRTWLRTNGCSGGGAEWIIHDSIFPNRDYPIRLWFDLGDTSIPPTLPFGCPSDFTGPLGDPDRFVGIDEFLAILANWGDLAPPRPAGDIAPCDPPPGECRGDNVVGIDDFLAVLADWGECPNLNDECTEALAFNNEAAFITQDGSYFFEYSGNLDGPMRGPTNSLNVVFSGPTTCGWLNFGAGGLPGGFQFGDAFGIDQRTGAIDGDNWFTYKAPCSGRAFFETLPPDCSVLGLSVRNVIEVYPGGNCDMAWQDVLACASGNSGSCTDGQNHANTSVNVIEGEEFLVRVAGWLGHTGIGFLTTTCVDNSNCAAALPASIGGSLTGQTFGATAPGDLVGTPPAPFQGPGPCEDAPSQDVGGRWYLVTGDGNTMTATTCATAATETFTGPEASVFDSTISVFCTNSGEGCPTTLNVFDCIAGSNGDVGCNFHESVSWCSVEGQEYYILVHGSDAGPGGPVKSEGFFILDISTDETECLGARACGQPRPANDNCINASTITEGAPDMAGVITTATNINNNNSTAENTAQTPGCGTVTNDVWFSYTPSATGNVVFSTCNTNNIFDTRIEIWDKRLANDCPVGGPGDGLILCLNDTFGCPGFGFTSAPILVFAGQELLLRIGSPLFGTQEGTSTIVITNTTLESFCPQVCDPLAVLENGDLGEDLLDDWDGVTPTVDGANGGCDLVCTTPMFDLTTDDVIICGKISTYVSDDDRDCAGGLDGVSYALRDTDWYEIVVPNTPGPTLPGSGGSHVTITLSSEFPALFGVTAADDVCGATPEDNPAFVTSAINGGLCVDTVLDLDLRTGTHWIVVTSFLQSGVEVGGGHEGHNYQMAISPFSEAALPPVNDDCANSLLVGANSSHTIDNRFATNSVDDYPASCHFNGPLTIPTGTAWYTFVAGATTQTIETCASTIGADSTYVLMDHDPTVIPNPCAPGALTEVACAEDDCNGFLSRLQATGLTIGKTYYFQFGSFGQGDVSIYDLQFIAP